jgi:hypothetical protein
MSVPIASPVEPDPEAFIVSGPENYERDVTKAAELLEKVEMSGWDLAELTALWVFTSNKPHVVARERKEGRVPAKDWSDAVTAKGRVRFSETTARAYARCWRKYGTNRQDWSFSDHLQDVWGHSKIEVTARRVDAEPIPNGGSTRIVLKGHTPDEVEDFVAAVGAVGAVANEQFGGDYAHAGGQPTERDVKTASAGARATGMKEIVLIFSLADYEEWCRTISERKKAWGCDSGSAAALELLRRSGSSSPDELEARFTFWLAMNHRDLDPERQALARAAFSAGAQVAAIGRPLPASEMAKHDAEGVTTN